MAGYCEQAGFAELPETTEEAKIVWQVDPARLCSGEWCHRSEKEIGRGDIAASYSADRIGMDQPVRRPFEWQGSLWICVGTSRHDGRDCANAYRLVHPSRFSGEHTTYREKTSDGDTARADRLGFYHGMSVKLAKAEMVLCGPPAYFVAGQKQQLNLFE